MHVTWLDAAGRLSLLGFHGLVAGLCAAMLVRLGHALRTSRPFPVIDRHPRGRFGRVFFEYLGNMEAEEPASLRTPVGPEDRRRNLRGRELVDWIKEQLGERGFPVAKEQEFLRDLREAMRDDGWMTADDGRAEVPASPEGWGQKD